MIELLERRVTLEVLPAVPPVTTLELQTIRCRVIERGTAGPQGPIGVGTPGPPGPPGSGVDLHYEHVQVLAQAQWDITHNLGKTPSITVVDSAGTTVEGSILYLNLNQARAFFSAPFSGTAECN